MKVYSHKKVKLFVEDTFVVAKKLFHEGKRVRLAFLDPPFNYDRDYGKGVDDNLPPAEYEKRLQRWLYWCTRILHRNGVLIVNIPDEHAALVDWMMTRTWGFKRLNWVVWYYTFGQNMKSKFCPSKVHVLIYAKGDEHVWNWQDILVPSARATVYNDPRTRNKKDGTPSGMRVPMDVWHGPGFARVNGNCKERRHGHDNQLPEAYMRRIVLAYTDKGDVVYDAFCGSGTLPTVAQSLGRSCYAVEKSPQHARSAFKRIKQGVVTGGDVK